MWGFLQFSGLAVGHVHDPFVWNNIEDAKWALREVYYAERQYFIDHGAFTDNVSGLNLMTIKSKDYNWPPRIDVTPNMFEATLSSNDGHILVHIRQDGMTWQTNEK